MWSPSLVSLGVHNNTLIIAILQFNILRTVKDIQAKQINKLQRVTVPTFVNSFKVKGLFTYNGNLYNNDIYSNIYIRREHEQTTNTKEVLKIYKTEMIYYVTCYMHYAKQLISLNGLELFYSEFN